MKYFEILTITLFVAIGSVLVGCNEMRLKATIAAENDNCPQRISENIVITKVQLNENYIEFVCDFEDGYKDKDGYMIRVADLNDDSILKKLKNVMFQEIINPKNENDTEEYKEVIDLCKSCKVGLMCHLIGSRTKEECVVGIDYWEFP